LTGSGYLQNQNKKPAGLGIWKLEVQNCQFWVFQKPQRIAGFHERVADSLITGSFPVN
jgi:hypothetical protein